MNIDSHHHLWHYDPSDYPWIRPEMTVLRRDYLPTDLKANLEAAALDGTVAVQARQKIEETAWLLECAAQHPFIRGVVGWVPLIDEKVEAHLDRFAVNPLLKAVRHVLHDEPDDAYMLREDFQRGIAKLERFNLVYDVLIFARHLPNTLAFVDRHPEQPFVVDHIAKPVIAAKAFDQDWAKHIRQLAKRPNLACKLSGLVTEVRDPEWSLELIRPYFETVLEAFRPNRLMVGTDWPVCLLRCSYPDWITAVRQLIRDLYPSEQAQIMGETAQRVYRL